MNAQDMLTKLVGFNTISSQSNLELIQFVQNYLQDHHIPSHLVYNQEGTKANLFATIGPQVAGGIVLSGHTDVVPVEGQPWDTDPFTLTEKGDRLYGRGTCDMKGFSAVGLSLVPEMLKAELKRPIHFALSYDEEVGCTGVPTLVEAMEKNLPPIDAVIVGEPSMMNIIDAHKSLHAYKTVVTGSAAHSSLTHQGVSAVMNAAILINFLQEQADDLRLNADPNSRFDPPYTTIHVGVVHGGTALNIISEHCEFLWDVRAVPGDDPGRYADLLQNKAKELLAKMHQVAPDTTITTTRIANASPFRPEPNGGRAREIVSDILKDQEAAAVSYVTEAGIFQDAGYSTIICGPGSIEQAHKPNEYVSLEQLTMCEEFLRALIDRQAMPFPAS